MIVEWRLSMKGIVLAGGNGTRLYPMTKVISKPLLPIYDKPMVYYPLSILMYANIKDIMVISAPEDIDSYKRLLGDGSQFGINIAYGVQYVARGIADAFIIAEDFIENDSVCLVLGDNMFHGKKLYEMLNKIAKSQIEATVFGYYVDNPSAFGVAEFDEDMNVISIEEKPKKPKSNYVVPGLYFYDNSVVSIAKNLEPSPRGELEITAVNSEYLKRKQLKVALIDDNTKWLDAGTPEGLMESALYVSEKQKESTECIACLEEIAYEKGYISRESLKATGESMQTTEYGKYILSLVSR